MLRILSLEKTGFNESLNVGDVVEEDKEKYIVVSVEKLDIIIKKGVVQAKVIAQQIGSENISGKYKRQVSFNKKMNCQKSRGFQSVTVGTAIYDEKVKTVIRILSIDSFSYEFLDLIITFSGEVIQEMSKQEVDRWIKKNRLSTFKVISSENRMHEE